MKEDETVLLTLLAVDVDRYYEQLMRVYVHRLSAYAFWRTRCVEDTEDIVQETFLRVLLALRTYSAQRICTLSLKAWLYKIVHNVTLSHMSRRFSCTSLDAGGGDFEEIIDEYAEIPELTVLLKERRNELEMLVQALPGKPREAIQLHYFDEMRYDEIAQVRECKTAKVRFHVYRGLHLLQRTVPPHLQEVS